MRASEPTPIPTLALSQRMGMIGYPTGRFQGYRIALLTSLGVTLAAIPLLPYLDHANLVMFFLLAVVGVAASYGRGPAV